MQRRMQLRTCRPGLRDRIREAQVHLGDRHGLHEGGDVGDDADVLHRLEPGEHRVEGH